MNDSNSRILTTLGARIRYFRMIARMTQGDLAKASKLTNGYLSDVERGQVNISVTNLDAVATALNVPIAVLLENEAPLDLQKHTEHLSSLPPEAQTALHALTLMIPRKE